MSCKYFSALALLAAAVHAGPFPKAVPAAVTPAPFLPLAIRQVENGTVTSSAAPASSLATGVIATSLIDDVAMNAALEVTDEEELPTPASACSLETYQATTWEQTIPGYSNSETTVAPETDTYSLDAGVNCRCEETIIAGFYKSLGRDGQTTYFCATGGTYSTAAPISTGVAGGEPGDPNNAAWADVRRLHLHHDWYASVLSLTGGIRLHAMTVA